MLRKPDDPVYAIGVVARILDTHPQTLRMYERLGLIEPRRLRHARLYSDEDVERLRRIQHLTQDMGVNLAGVEVVFSLLEQMEEMRQQMEDEMRRLRAEMEQEMRAALARLTSEPRKVGRQK